MESTLGHECNDIWPSERRQGKRFLHKMRTNRQTRQRLGLGLYVHGVLGQVVHQGSMVKQVKNK